MAATSRGATELRRSLREALSRGDLRRAASLLERLEAADPLSAETRGMRLQLLVKRGATSEALDLARQLERSFPDSPGVLYWGGRAAFLAKDYELAARRLREGLKAKAHPATERWLGKALTNLGRFEEAEPILSRLAEASPKVLVDLAWLHERMGEPRRALEAIAAYLEAFPENAFALEQQRRLRARAIPDEELLEEVETLAELGEEVPAEILPEAVERLLAAGRGDEARALVRDRLDDLEPRTAQSLGWVAYRAVAYDLAFDLFVHVLPSAPTQSFKLLNSLEKAARVAGRLEDLAAAYEKQSERTPSLLGRLAKVRRHLDEQKPG